MPQSQHRLLKRLFLISLPLTLLVGVLYGGVIAYVETATLKGHQLAAAYDRIKQQAETLAIPTWNLDQHFLEEYLKQFAADPHMICIELLSDSELNVQAPEGCEHPPEPEAMVHTAPIVYEEQYVGVLIASFNIELDDQRLMFILLSRIPIALLALISIFFMVFLVFQRWVIVPINAIMESINQFQSHGEHKPVSWESKDEIGTLVNVFNSAQKQQLEHEQSLMSAKEKAERALTELKDAQSQLVESEKMASLGGLVAGISHEINTPLGVARTSSSHVWDALKALKKHFDEGSLTKKEMQDFLDLADDGLHLMTANIIRAGDLVASFKQVSADQSHDEKRLFSLHEYLNETAYTLKPNLKRYQVAVLIDCPDDILINSYPGAYSQVVTNLIMNSLNHAYDKEDIGTINIKVEKKGEVIRITFADDGRGMDEETQKRIFEPFFTTKRGKGGTGLGMHIIYNLITHKLQGNIEVESTPGMGTKFVLTLPIELAEIEAEPDDSE